MHISFPIGFLLKGWNWLRNKLFLQIYVQSHSFWASMRALGSQWQNTGYFEYSIYLPQMTDPEELRSTRLALRSSGKPIATLGLVVEAVSTRYRFQQSVSVHDIDTTPVIVTLSGIPHQDVDRFDPAHGVLCFNWNQCSIKVNKLICGDGTEVKCFSLATSTLTHTWFLNSSWVRFNETFYNTDAIEFAMREIGEYWKFGFMNNALPYPIGQGSKGPAFYLVLPVRWLMANRFCVWLQFWLSIWSKRGGFDREGRFTRRTP